MVLHNLPGLLKDQRQKLLFGKERKPVYPKVHSLLFCPFRSLLFYLSAGRDAVCLESKHCLPVASPLYYMQLLQPAHLVLLSSFSRTVSLLVFLGLLTVATQQSASEFERGGFFCVFCRECLLFCFIWKAMSTFCT